MEMGIAVTAVTLFGMLSLMVAALRSEPVEPVRSGQRAERRAA